MNFLTQVISLLNIAFPSLTVYRNVIPEGIDKPCISVTEVANTTKRVISGVKFGTASTWRVAVHVSDDSEMQALLDILEDLDNTSNNDFQRIFSDYVLTEIRQPNQLLTRAFYDLNLYK